MSSRSAWGVVRGRVLNSVFAVGIVAGTIAGAARAEPSATTEVAKASGDSAEPAGPARGVEDAAAPVNDEPWEPGPKSVSLGHEITVNLPEGYAYLAPEPAKKLLEKNGSFHNEGVLGLLVSALPDQDWFTVIRFDDSGFVKDDEKLDGDEILSSLRDGLDDLNDERKEHGFKALSLDGWAEPPHYDQAQHHVVWALIVSDPDGKSINLNTRILGRKGYVSLNLVTDPAKLSSYRHHATTLLSATGFNGGARYEDFVEGKDKVAEYGLAGLVMAGAGLGAAKLVKLGLLAKFSKVILGLLIAGKKVVIAAVIGLGLWLKSLFSKKNEQPPADPAV